MRLPAGVPTEAASGGRMSLTKRRQFSAGSTWAALEAGSSAPCVCAGPQSRKLRSRNQSEVRMMAEELRKSSRRKPRRRMSCSHKLEV